MSRKPRETWGTPSNMKSSKPLNAKFAKNIRKGREEGRWLRWRELAENFGGDFFGGAVAVYYEGIVRFFERGELAG